MYESDDSSNVVFCCSSGREDESESADSLGDSEQPSEMKTDSGWGKDGVSAEDCDVDSSSRTGDADGDESFGSCNGWLRGDVVDGDDSINDVATDDNCDSGKDFVGGGDDGGVDDGDDDADDEIGDDSTGDDSDGDSDGDDGGDCWDDGGGDGVGDEGGDDSVCDLDGGCNNVRGKSSWIIDLLLGLPVLPLSISE